MLLKNISVTSYYICIYRMYKSNRVARDSLSIDSLRIRSFERLHILGSTRCSVFIYFECKARRKHSYSNTYFIQCEASTSYQRHARERRRTAVSSRSLNSVTNRTGSQPCMSRGLTGQGQRGPCGSIVFPVNYCLLQHKALKSRRII